MNDMQILAGLFGGQKRRKVSAPRKPSVKLGSRVTVYMGGAHEGTVTALKGADGFFTVALDCGVTHRGNRSTFEVQA